MCITDFGALRVQKVLRRGIYWLVCGSKGSLIQSRIFAKPSTREMGSRLILACIPMFNGCQWIELQRQDQGIR